MGNTPKKYVYSASSLDELETNAFKKRIVVELRKYNIYHVCLDGSCGKSIPLKKYNFKYFIANTNTARFYSLISIKTYDLNPKLDPFIFNIWVQPVNCDAIDSILDADVLNYVAVQQR